MDEKQKRIYHNIISGFGLNKKNKFVQHRNLSEFKYFKIERINPNHIIILYGKLKNNKNKNHVCKGFVKVGEIYIYGTTAFLNLNIILENINSIVLLFNLSFLAFVFYVIIRNYSIRRVFYVDWNRRFFRGWKNYRYGSI